MIPRNEETNSEILLQFFPVTWAKYFYDELVCQSLGSTLLVFVSNFPSFMSIGRKQHNGYQLLAFLILTAPNPAQAPQLQVEIKMSTSVHWSSSSLISQHLIRGLQVTILCLKLCYFSCKRWLRGESLWDLKSVKDNKLNFSLSRMKFKLV